MRRKQNPGFTLVEILIAAAILTFAVCSLVAVLVRIMILTEINREKIIAINDAQKVMEQIMDTPYALISTVDWKEWAATHGCNTLTKEDISVPSPEDLAPDSHDLIEITITLTWEYKGRALSISLTNLKYAG